jgi:hypothetical protein
MSERILETLSRFTPNAAGLDRDSLLYAAGRASVRPNRAWIALTSVLASTQLLSLFVLWPRSQPNSVLSQVAGPVAAAPAPRPGIAPRAGEASVSPARRYLRRSLQEPVSAYRPPDNLALIDSVPPLRANGPSRRSLLN